MRARSIVIALVGACCLQVVDESWNKWRAKVKKSSREHYGDDSHLSMKKRVASEDSEDVGQESGGVMGAKKIGEGDPPRVGSPAPQVEGGRGERMMSVGSGAKSSVGYAGIVKMGLNREGREVLGSANGATSSSMPSSPDRIGESGRGSGSHNSNGGNDNGPSKATTTGGGAQVDLACTVEQQQQQQRPIDEAMNVLSVQGEDSDAGATEPQLEALRTPEECLVVDSGSTVPGERIGMELLPPENGGPGSESASKEESWQDPVVDFEALNVSAQQQPSQMQPGRDQGRCPSHSERDYRELMLILPETGSMETAFVCQEQESADTGYDPPQSYLPRSLVMSPREAKNLLDPNAREFTPSPSPCPSPSLAGNLVSIVQPSPYHMDPTSHHIPYAPTGMEFGRVMHNTITDLNGTPVLPLFPNGGSLVGGMSRSLTPWDTQHMGMGMPGSELSHHMVSLPTAPPPMVGQHHQHPPTTLLRPYVSASTLSSYLATAGCSPSTGSPTGSVPVFAAPPPLTGREHVSRALLLSGVPTELTDSSLQQELEQWGLVRALGLERRHEGLVTVHYFDLRHSKEALKDIQHQHLLQQQRMQQKIQQQIQRHRSSSSSGPAHGVQNEDSVLEVGTHDFLNEPVPRDNDITSPARGLIGGKAVWAQYTVPGGAAAGPDSHNQGTLVVFNLDVDMPLDELRAAFEGHGAVKELRETPAKRQHKFVEYFDVRDAARALAALDGQEIGGKRVKIEFSRPGGQARRARAQAQAQVLAQQQQQQHQHQHVQQQQGTGPSMVPMIGNRLNAAAAGGPAVPPGAIQGQPIWWGADPSMGPAHGAMAAPPGPPTHYMWSFPPPVAHLGALVQQQQHWNVAPGQLQPLMYPQVHGLPVTGGVGAGLVPMGSENLHHNRHFGGRDGYGGGGGAGGSSGGSGFHSQGGGGFGRGGGNHHNHNGGGGSGSGSSSSSSSGPARGGGGIGGGGDEGTGRRRRGGGSSNNSNGSLTKMDLACIPSCLGDGSRQGADGGGARDSPRSGRTGLTPKSSPREHAQYVFNLDEIDYNSDNPRTTVMIKNIPNKYSQSMLLTLLDQHCIHCNSNLVDPNEPQSGYDFVYLPIDFKNRCNLGYAFVNFTSIQGTVKLYKAFHAQQWEAFNSRKICQVAYARVQGRIALQEHFRNSRFACDTDEFLPLIFIPPRTGIVCPPPIVCAGHLAGHTMNNSGRDPQGSRSTRNGDPQPSEPSSDQAGDSKNASSDEQESESSAGSSSGGGGGPGSSASGFGRSRPGVSHR